MLVSLEGSESYIKQNSPKLLWRSPSLDIGFLAYLLTIAVGIRDEFDSLLFIRDAQ